MRVRNQFILYSNPTLLACKLNPKKKLGDFQDSSQICHLVK